MLQIRLSTGPNEAVKLNGITIRGSGTGDEVVDVSAVTLYLDADGDGQKTAVDTLLGTGLYTQNDGDVVFQGSGGSALVSLAANDAVDLLVLYSFGGSASHGDIFVARLDSSADLDLEGTVTLAPVTATGAFPLVGADMEVVIPGTLSVSLGPRTPLSTYEMIGSQQLSMLQVAVAANENEDLKVTRMSVHASGTGHDVIDVVTGSIRLYQDVDRNGILSAPDEEIFPTAYPQWPQFPVGWGSFASDDGVATFDFLEEIVTASTAQYWIVVMDIANTAGLATTFSVEIQADTDVVAEGLRSLGPAMTSGAPVVGGTKTVVAWGTGGSLSIYPGLNTPPTRSELNNASNVEVLQLSLVASTVEAVQIDSLTLSHRGTGIPQQDIAPNGVRFFRDTAGNGLLDSNDVLLGSGTYDVNGEVTFLLPSGEVIPANSEMNYIVVYDLAGVAPDGTTFICGVRQNTHIQAQGVESFATINIGGAPVDGAAMVIGQTGSLIVSYGPFNPGPLFVPESTNGILVMHLSFRATSPEPILVKDVTFHAGGTGDDANTVVATLYADVNGNGAVDSGEPILGSMNQPYDQDNGSVTFTDIDLLVNAGSTQYALLAYNFSIDPAIHWGDTYEVRLIPSLDVSCEGANTQNMLYSTGSILFSNRIKVEYPPGYTQYLNLPRGSSGGGCFIATASFGSRHNVEVKSLSAFRDQVLMKNAAGRWFVRTYYRLSPPVADFLRERPAARWMVRQALIPAAGFAGALTSPSPVPWILALLLGAVSLTGIALLARRSLRPARAKD
ncbi:MAG: CFI-box-CTERM domain-containing protein [Planctomycetota bacterium]